MQINMRTCTFTVLTISVFLVRGSSCPSLQVTALIVIVVGFLVAMCFQLFIHEKTGLNPPKLPWHKWLRNPQFYLVST